METAEDSASLIPHSALRIPRLIAAVVEHIRHPTSNRNDAGGFAFRDSERLPLGKPTARPGGPSCRQRQFAGCRLQSYRLQVLPMCAYLTNCRQLATINPQLLTSKMPGSVKVARRFVKPHGVGASPTLAANFRKAGRYKLAAPVSKTGSALPRSERYRRLPPNNQPKEVL